MTLVMLLGTTACGTAPTAYHTAASSVREDQASSSQEATGPNPSSLPVASPAAASGSPTAASHLPTSGAPLGILVDLSSSSSYRVSLVETDGTIAASVQAARRSVITVPSPNGPQTAVDLPYVNASRSRLYYLDGDSTVRWLAPGNNSQGVAGTIPGSPTAHAGFAVSPDNSRVAVSVIDYGAPQPVLRLFVGPLGGQLNQIFSSTSDFVWPVGWHAGNLVLATQNRAPFAQDGVQFNPYGAVSYHIADPVSADRLGTIGNPSDLNGCWPSGVLTVAGTACYLSTAFGGNSGGYGILDWLGNRYAQPVAASWSAAASVAPSPSATTVMVCCDQNSTTGHFVLSGEGGPTVTPLTGTASDWACWIDQTHVMSGTSGTTQTGASAVLDLSSLKMTSVGAQGFCAGVLPTALG